MTALELLLLAAVGIVAVWAVVGGLVRPALRMRREVEQGAWWGAFERDFRAYVEAGAQAPEPEPASNGLRAPPA